MSPLDDDAFDVVLQGTVHVSTVAFPHLTIKVYLKYKGNFS